MIETGQVCHSSRGVISPGLLLRQAREAKGLSVAELAALLRVPVRTLDALESDRWDHLPGLAFTRPLALTLCRFLGIDPDPVMNALPQMQLHRIEQISEGLNEPFRDRRFIFSGRSAWLSHPMTLLGGLVLMAAALLQQLPQSLPAVSGRVHHAEKPQGLLAESVYQDGLVEASPESPLVSPDFNSTETEATKDPNRDPLGELLMSLEAQDSQEIKESQRNRALELRVRAPSWVEVQDASGKIVFSRLLRPSQDPVYVGGTDPLRVKIGNANATEVRYRGQIVDLSTVTRDNIARLDLH
ncbi:MAG: helix-turn-helix domain-containing protein [Burkholderiales bacterium]|jgi:cytoskeleton protein RodZ